jgi:hypothetical protein
MRSTCLAANSEALRIIVATWRALPTQSDACESRRRASVRRACPEREHGLLRVVPGWACAASLIPGWSPSRVPTRLHSGAHVVVSVAFEEGWGA